MHHIMIVIISKNKSKIKKFSRTKCEMKHEGLKYHTSTCDSLIRRIHIGTKHENNKK